MLCGRVPITYGELFPVIQDRGQEYGNQQPESFQAIFRQHKKRYYTEGRIKGEAKDKKRD